jgi:putative transposase
LSRKTFNRDSAMPRRARLRLAGCPVHLVQRGNNRTPCFFADRDYALYLNLVAEHAGRFDCAIHAYVLMTNHIHLLLTPAAGDGLSQLMRHVDQRYVQFVNRTYRRTGTLWEGRFRSSLVQEQHYLLRCYRYIELNPVRAGMVKHPADYAWSSHRLNARAASSKFLTPHPTFVALGTTEQQRAAAYLALFRSVPAHDEVETIRNCLNGGFALGDSSFKAELAATLKRRVEPGVGGRPAKSRRAETNQQNLI